MKSAALQSAPLGKERVNLQCEVCGHEGSSPWRVLGYPELRHPGAFDLRRCDGCGLVFNSPRLVADALARLYDRNYYVFNEPVAAAFERVVGLHQATVAQLETRLGALPGRLLEVGSAKGYMLALMRDRGWRAEGIELSEHAARFANESLQAPTFHGTLEGWVDRPGSQPHPAVYSTDVIEHVPSPRRFVQALGRATAPGGLVLIGTPNVGSDGVREHGDHWLGFNPFHIWLFSRATLGLLLERNGFEVLESYSFGNVTLARDPEMPPARRWLRGMLGRAGVLAPLRNMRSARVPATGSGELAALRARAAQALASAPDWRQTADGLHPRAAASSGDNLVVIARRRMSPA